MCPSFEIVSAPPKASKKKGKKADAETEQSPSDEGQPEAQA
jgi:hypothetical protein